MKTGKAQLPRVDTALALARGLGVNPSWLAFELGPKNMSDRDEIAKLLDEMPIETQKAMLVLLKKMLPIKHPEHLQLIADFVHHQLLLTAQLAKQADATPPADEASPS